MQDARDPRAFTLPPQATCRGQRDKGISVHHVAMHDVLRTRCLAGDGFLRRELLALGYDDNAIAAKVRAGEWVRVRQGGYFLTPKVIQIALRGAIAEVSNSDREQLEVRGAFNYFLSGHALKLATDFGFTKLTGENAAGVSDDPDLSARVMAQFTF